MSLKILLVLVATTLVAGPASTAVGATSPGGCPAGYVAFDRQTGDGGPPRYRQGETVAASGVITNTDAGVTEVTLRWGTADGPEIGRAAVDANGTWQGISFQIPQDVADGEQQVFYVARDRSGAMLPGLPYPFAISIGAPAAPAARETAPSTTSAAVAPRSSTKKAARSERPAATAAAPSARKAAPVRTKPTRTAPAPVAAQPRARARTEATKRPARPARRSSPSARSSRASRPSVRTVSTVERFDSGTRLTRPDRSERPNTSSPVRPAAPTLVDTTDPKGSDAWDAATVFAALGLLLLLGFGAYGAGVVAGRRRGDGGDSTGGAPGTPEAACPVESELHAMLAAHEADAAVPERQDAAPMR